MECIESVARKFESGNAGRSVWVRTQGLWMWRGVGQGLWDSQSISVGLSYSVSSARQVNRYWKGALKRWAGFPSGVKSGSQKNWVLYLVFGFFFCFSFWFLLQFWKVTFQLQLLHHLGCIPLLENASSSLSDTRTVCLPLPHLSVPSAPSHWSLQSIPCICEPASFLLDS